MTTSRGDYFERKAGGYLEASRKGLWGRFKAAEWRAVRECLDLAPGMSVLDAGCGAGYYSLRMRGEAGADISGFDPSPAMIKAYRAQGFEGQVGRAETFGSGRRYDRILLAGVLEFIVSPDAALKNLAGLLRGGGRLVCLVPEAGLPGLVYKAVHSFWNCPAEVRDASFYLRLAGSAGLKIVRSVRTVPVSRTFALQRERYG